MVAYHRDWRATPNGNAKFSRANAATRARYPERDHARELVTAALRSGKLQRGPCCLADATCSAEVDAHHDDYTQPLDVRWVCRTHHRRLDRERRRAAVRQGGERQ